MTESVAPDSTHQLRRALLSSNVAMALFFVSLIVPAFIINLSTGAVGGTWRGYVIEFTSPVVALISVWLASQARRSGRALGQNIDPRDRGLQVSVSVFTLIVIIFYMAVSFFGGLGQFFVAFFNSAAPGWESYVVLVIDAAVIVIAIVRGILAPKGASDE